ncbi:MFS transporter [Streptomyces carpaticus]|uniref:MFS transporter n=1 Tax=Streptomyces carpaticus TaxID=285558 RepID=A0ABV4ZV95_9ACTN
MPSLNKFRAGSERGARTAGVADPHLRQLRYALTAFFAVDGFVFAGWVVRIPAVKEQTGASASALGLALLGVSAGAVVTMTLTGRLCQRLGNHPVTVGAALLLSASVALPPHAHSAVVLGAMLLFFGAGFGGMNVAVNSAAVDLVVALGRPVMPGFHAAFSLGGMVGAGAGGLVAGSLSPAWHLSGLALIGVLVTVMAGRTLLAAPVPAPPRAADEGADGAPARPAAGPVGWLVVVLGVVAACTAYGEGALADWSALHLRETLLAGEGPAAAGYSVFALAMTVGRLSGTWLLLRLGQTRAMVTGGTVAAAGMLLASLAPSVGLALVGFVVTGLGLANLFPVAIGQAGALAGPRGVAAASTVGYGGMLLGPVAIGFLAEWFSLAAALTSVAALSAVAAVIAYALRGSVPDTA